MLNKTYPLVSNAFQHLNMVVSYNLVSYCLAKRNNFKTLSTFLPWTWPGINVV